MSHSIISDNGSSTTSGVTTQRRRRLAAWLLLGWATFWLATVIQPCCSNLAGPQANAEQRIAVPMGSDAMWNANWDCGVPLGEGSCESVSVATISPSDTATGPTRADLPFGVTLAAAAPLPRHASTTIAYAPTDSPSPGAPLYLRYQRFLI